MVLVEGWEAVAVVLGLRECVFTSGRGKGSCDEGIYMHGEIIVLYYMLYNFTCSMEECICKQIDKLIMMHGLSCIGDR